MLIRVEIGIDAPGIDALLRRAFNGDGEASLVRDLREDGLITLGLVATDDEGHVVGYVAFSPVSVEGEELQWVGLAPVAVDEEYRGQGLARQMIYEGLVVSALNVPRSMIYAAAGRAPKRRLWSTLWRMMR
mgnify:CR=1 FL=1